MWRQTVTLFHYKALAQRGKDYREILTTYFPGAVINTDWILTNAFMPNN